MHFIQERFDWDGVAIGFDRVSYLREHGVEMFEELPIVIRKGWVGGLED
jgi:hypothetical protein